MITLQMAECYLRKFVKVIIKCFCKPYLRAPIVEDTKMLLEMNATRGFPEMLGSIDCMNQRWNNYLTAWHGKFIGHAKDPTIILEAAADRDKWI
jgi:hypothetical protein